LLLLVQIIVQAENCARKSGAPDVAPVEQKKSAKAEKAEAAKVIADAKTEAEEILKAAKEAADKMIAEAEELAKAEKAK